MTELLPELSDEQFSNLEESILTVLSHELKTIVTDVTLNEVTPGHYSYDINLNISQEIIGHLIK